jgi:hypothetical protein
MTFRELSVTEMSDATGKFMMMEAETFYETPNIYLYG